MTSPSPAAAETADDPACPLVARPVAFEAIPRATWDALLTRTARPTPFSRWTWQRAWWDAYGDTAHQQYLVCLRSGVAEGPFDVRAVHGIVPLMHRHALEAEDAMSTTVLRHAAAPDATPVAPGAKAVYFAASYHADYATLLCSPEDLPEVALAVAEALAGPPDLDHGAEAWDVVDLRRLHQADPAADALEMAFRSVGRRAGWDVVREQEDVCPVVTVAPDLDWDGYLATLDKKDRHEIRRKVRRAEAAGPNVFRLVDPTAQTVDAFIDLHQARWGEEGLFPATAGGARSRRFLHRLAELEADEGPARQLQLGHFEVDGRLIFASLGFDDGTCYFYNAGMDPGARELSPGVTGAAAYLRYELGEGRRRFDFLRGEEPYKYEWGARDEAIQRVLVRRGSVA
ncbi:MAG: GNAT family N-acetyltransferase [Candidatus Limnocylindrales bacterium]